ncbi:MAG: heavy-metal-associated domain-containing protein [Candidatus Woesearchaeota archaeon]
MKTKIYVPDIECDSCVKLLHRKFKHTEGVTEYDVTHDSVDVTYDETIIEAKELVEMIEEMGFRASKTPFERKTFSERWRDLRQNPYKYEMPLKAAYYSIAIFLILSLLEIIAYFAFFTTTPGFIAKHAIWFLYLNITVASLGATLWYMTSYKGTVTCMTGMMIGMTVGMQAGMMIGAVMGGTNGFFTGALVGMFVAVILGTITGAVCGIMGAVQGMMTGVMAGTMGAMITVMMFTDHVLIFMPFYMIINVLVLGGLIYIFYEEVVEGKKDVKKKTIDFTTFASLSIIATTLLIIIMVYGPKSPLFS